MTFKTFRSNTFKALNMQNLQQLLWTLHKKRYLLYSTDVNIIRVRHGSEERAYSYSVSGVKYIRGLQVGGKTMDISVGLVWLG